MFLHLHENIRRQIQHTFFYYFDTVGVFFISSFPLLYNLKFRYKKRPLSWKEDVFCMERIAGIEPVTSAWEANILPLNYIRMSVFIL